MVDEGMFSGGFIRVFKMKIKNRLWLLFGALFTPLSKLDYLDASENSDFMQGVVAERSHGSVYLQLGKYLTEDELDAKYDAIKDFKFV